jgi:putative transcriptional regulator
MPGRKALDEDAVRLLRAKLHDDIEAGGLPISQTIRRMREAMGLTQARFAKLFKLTERQVWELEKGRANPTAETLQRLGKPFGFQPGFIIGRRS